MSDRASFSRDSQFLGVTSLYTIFNMPNKKDFETFFDEADVDKSGFLSPKELYNILKKFGFKLDKSKLKVGWKI